MIENGSFVSLGAIPRVLAVPIEALTEKTHMAKATRNEETSNEVAGEEEGSFELEFEKVELQAPFLQWPKDGGIVLQGTILGFSVAEPSKKAKFDKPRHIGKLRLMRDVTADLVNKKTGEVKSKLYPKGTACRFDIPAGLQAIRELPTGTAVRISCKGKRQGADGGNDVWQFDVGQAKA